jgi:hypothetical protein
VFGVVRWRGVGRAACSGQRSPFARTLPQDRVPPIPATCNDAFRAARHRRSYKLLHGAPPTLRASGPQRLSHPTPSRPAVGLVPRPNLAAHRPAVAPSPSAHDRQCAWLEGGGLGGWEGPMEQLVRAQSRSWHGRNICKLREWEGPVPPTSFIVAAAEEKAERVIAARTTTVVPSEHFDPPPVRDRPGEPSTAARTSGEARPSASPHPLTSASSRFATITTLRHTTRMCLAEGRGARWLGGAHGATCTSRNHALRTDATLQVAGMGGSRATETAPTVSPQPTRLAAHAPSRDRRGTRASPRRHRGTRMIQPLGRT